MLHIQDLTLNFYKIFLVVYDLENDKKKMKIKKNKCRISALKNKKLMILKSSNFRLVEKAVGWFQVAQSVSHCQYETGFQGYKMQVCIFTEVTLPICAADVVECKLI